MNGQELKERRNKLKIIRWHFSNLLGVTTDTLYRWESGKTPIPPHIEQAVQAIEEKLNKPKTRSDNFFNK
jgi:DNA-binding transcriptional regulator YiaG